MDGQDVLSQMRSFNTQPPEGGWPMERQQAVEVSKFQHTAARRRLAVRTTHSPKPTVCFNTQPPEGGWGHFAIFR